MSIGIFWVYKDTVIGRTCSIELGSQSVPGLIDSDFSHYELWENGSSLLKKYPELIGTEYQVYPRGRVIYSLKDKKYLVYLDRTLMTDSIKKLIREFFSLEGKRVKWLQDPHYVTFDEDINCLD